MLIGFGRICNDISLVLFGAISAGVAQGIGDWAGKTFFGGNLEAGHAVSYFSGSNFAAATAKATLHGLTRGVITAAQGGKFGAGFASGFVSSGFAVGKDTFESLKGAAVAARTAVMAVVGGVTSEITGGKFANGAITGAFVHLFNHESKTFFGGVKSVKEGLNRFGDYLAKVTGFRDWQEGSIMGNFYQEEALEQTKNTYKIVKYIANNSEARIV